MNDEAKKEKLKKISQIYMKPKPNVFVQVKTASIELLPRSSLMYMHIRPLKYFNEKTFYHVSPAHEENYKSCIYRTEIFRTPEHDSEICLFLNSFKFHDTMTPSYTLCVFKMKTRKGFTQGHVMRSKIFLSLNKGHH